MSIFYYICVKDVYVRRASTELIVNKDSTRVKAIHVTEVALACLLVLYNTFVDVHLVLLVPIVKQLSIIASQALASNYISFFKSFSFRGQ